MIPGLPGEPVRSLLVMGVRFYWTGSPPVFDQNNLRESDAVHARILAVAADAMRRRGRTRVEFVDGMMYLEEGDLPKRVRELKEVQVAQEILPALARGMPRPDRVRELVNLPGLGEVRSRLVEETGESGHLEYGADGRPHSLARGFRRSLELDAGAIDISPNRLDWERMVALAVLIQVQAELELRVITGFQRVHRCQHRACRGWFEGERMAAKQRFCSAYCRVTSSRRQPA